MVSVVVLASTSTSATTVVEEVVKVVDVVLVLAFWVTVSLISFNNNELELLLAEVASVVVEVDVLDVSLRRTSRGRLVVVVVLVELISRLLKEFNVLVLLRST